jgi:cyclin-dependent kinase regulatory subunit CKS1
MLKRTSGPGGGLAMCDPVVHEQASHVSVHQPVGIGNSSSLTLSTEDLTQRERDILEHSGDIFYSKRYNDDRYEYRHVILPKQIAKYYKADRLLSESEWRALGVQQSPGWIHYMIHKPEPHVLLFRRELDPSTLPSSQVG